MSGSGCDLLGTERSGSYRRRARSTPSRHQIDGRASDDQREREKQNNRRTLSLSYLSLLASLPSAHSDREDHQHHHRNGTRTMRSVYCFHRDWAVDLNFHPNKLCNVAVEVCQGRCRLQDIALKYIIDLRQGCHRSFAIKLLHCTSATSNRRMG